MTFKTRCHGVSFYSHLSSESENKSFAGEADAVSLSASCRRRGENFFFDVMPSSVSISA